MGRRWLFAVAAWLVTAALTTAVAIGAVNSLRQGIFGPADAPRSESEVQAQLPASSTPPTPPSTGTPSAPASPEPTSSAPEVSRAFTTDGGTITASCAGGLAWLRSWIPKTGFESDHVSRGPAPTVSLRFKARSGGDAVRAQVTCVDGTPTLALGGHD
jgi:hypothetical protein